MESTRSCYGAYSLIYGGLDTGMHFTVFFRHDATPVDIREIETRLDGLGLSRGGLRVRITGFRYLDGPRGEPNHTWTCLLEILDPSGARDEEKTKELTDFGQTISFRRDLKEQYSYTVHCSVGCSDQKNRDKYDEYLKNENTIERMGGVGAEFEVGPGYVKDVESKEIMYRFT